MEQYRLDNGLTVILAPSQTAPVVAVQAWVGVGSVDEADSRAGISHVFEHMLFKGTERRGIGEIARAIEAAGGEINAWTSFHNTVFHVVLASRDLDIGIDVLADALQNSSFDATELEREREVVMEEILQSRDNPMRNVAQLLLTTSLTSHPYRRPVIGNEQSVRAMRRSHLLRFYRRFYVANNLTIVVVGDFDKRIVKRRIKQHFGAMRSGTIRRARRREAPQTESRAAVASQEVREAYVTMGVPIPALASPELPALDVAAIVLGQGESSRLWRRVRRERELVTGIHAHAQPLRERGMFIISATAQPDRLDQAVEHMTREALSMAEQPVSHDELTKAKRALEADIIYQRETVQGMARMYGYYHSNVGDIDFERRYLEGTLALASEDIQRSMRAHVHPEQMTVAAVVPRGELGRGGASARARRLLTQVRKGARGARKGARSKPTRRSRRARVANGPAQAWVSEVLESGMRVVVKRDPSVPVVAMRAVWPGGLRWETNRTNGISHLLARMLVRGCAGMSADQIVARLDEMAGSMSGISGRNSFGVRAEWLSRSWQSGLELLSRCIVQPNFDIEEIEREKRRMLEALQSRQDSPSFSVFRLFSEALYRKHPYRMDVAGSSEVIVGLDQRKLRAFYRRHYPLGSMTLAVVGDVDPAQIMDDIRSHFKAAGVRGEGGEPRNQPARSSAGAGASDSGLPEQRFVPAGRKIPRERFGGRSAASREVYHYLERNQAHLIIGFPGTTLDHPDRFALEVLATILGGQGGRLFVQLRERQALAYHISAVSIEGIDPGYFAVYMACSPEKLGAAVSGVRSQLQTVIDDPIGADELQRAKRYLIGTHEISLQRRSAVAASLAFHEAYGLGYEQVARYSAAIEAITAADIQRVARAYLDWQLSVTATVKPPDASPEAARRSAGRVHKAAKQRRKRTSRKRAAGARK